MIFVASMKIEFEAEDEAAAILQAEEYADAMQSLPDTLDVWFADLVDLT